MSSIIKLEKFKDGIQDVNAWSQSFTQLAKFYDLPDFKAVKTFFTFYLEGYVKVLYDSVPYEHKINPTLLTSLFQERFKELELFFGFVIITIETR